MIQNILNRMKQKNERNIFNPLIFPSISRQTLHLSSNDKPSALHTKSIYTPVDQPHDQSENTNFCKVFKQSLKSLEDILNNSPPKLYQSRQNNKKNKTLGAQKSQQLHIEEAEEVLTSWIKSPKERQNASRIVVQNLFKRAYGEDIRKIEEQRSGKQKSTSKSVLDVCILEQILTQIQHNPKSHSIIIRKSELGNIKNDLAKKKQEKMKKEDAKEQRRMQTIYRLKNEYNSLKNFIIPSKCEEYQNLMTTFVQNSDRDALLSMNSSSLKHTFLLTGLDKQNKVITNYRPSVYKTIEYFQKFKAFRNSSVFSTQRSSRFEKTQDKLIIENVNEFSPSTFLYLVSQCRFENLKIIKIRFLKATEELLFFFIDCMKALGNAHHVIDYFQLTSVTVQSIVCYNTDIKKLSEKLALLFQCLPIKVIKLQSMELTTRQFAKIGESLLKRKICEQLSLRHNRIDILGVRLMENMCEIIPTLHLIDIRNNEIPHYANLKDKNPIIQFF